MKTIKSKVKDESPCCKLFFCKKCGSIARGTISTSMSNKYFCNIRQTEEVFRLSGEHYLQELQRITRPTNYFYGATVNIENYVVEPKPFVPPNQADSFKCCHNSDL